MPLHAHLNTFAANPLDRAAERRRDGQWLEARLGAAETRLLAFWNGAPLVTDAEAGAPRLATLEPRFAAELGRGFDRLLFLGVDTDGQAVFALDLEGPADPSEGPLAGRGSFANLRDLAAL